MLASPSQQLMLLLAFYFSFSSSIPVFFSSVLLPSIPLPPIRVPFAQPPTGKLRLRDPLPKKGLITLIGNLLWVFSSFYLIPLALYLS